jgi:hypothetical protein
MSDEELSLRDEVSNAVSAQLEQPEPHPDVQEIEPQEPELDSEKSTSPARDEKGRFTAAEKPAEPEGAEPAPEPGARAVEPPPGFSVQTKAVWDTLPDHVKEDIAKREAEIDAGFKRYTGLGKFAEIAERNGRSLGDAVADYWGIEQSLRSNFLGGIEAICQKFGVDQKALTQALSQRYGLNGATPDPSQAPQPQQQQINPQALINHALERFRAEQSERDAASQIEAFRKDPANRFFENLRPAMQALLAGGQAQTLKEAYDAACWMNPDTRAILQAEQSAAPSPKKAAALNQARAAAKAVTGAPSPGVKPDQGNSIDQNASVKDIVRAAVNAQIGAV